MAPRPLCLFLLCLPDPLLLLELLLLPPELELELELAVQEVLEEVEELEVLEVVELLEVVAPLLLVGSCKENKKLEDGAVYQSDKPSLLSLVDDWHSPVWWSELQRKVVSVSESSFCWPQLKL